MKNTHLATIGLLTLALAAPAFAQGGPGGGPGPGGRGHHPEIRQVINKLRVAKQHLEQAAHDYQGHRVDAIKAIDNAIGQLETCLKYD